MNANDNSHESQYNPNKRKKKKTFLKNARKYAKKGCYGRGTQLDPDTYQYFVRIVEVYKEGFESDEDKAIFVSNVFEQTVGQEVDISCNQVGCRVIEMLLPFANSDALTRFMTAFSSDMRPLCGDRFATHVLEALVTKSCVNSLQKVSEDKEIDSFNASCKEFVLKVSKFLLNNLEDYIWDIYANHVIRTCLVNMAQLPKDTQKKGSDIKEEIDDCSLLPEYVEVVKDYGDRIICWPQFSELCNSELTSGFLQVLLRAIKKIGEKKLLKKYLDKLTSENFVSKVNDSVDTINPNVLPPVFLSKPLIMLLETALEVSKSKTFTQLYAKLFCGRLVKLSTTRNTNFSVQKLISNCREKSEFEAMFEELKDCFKDIVSAGHTGIIWALGCGCKKYAAKQGSFVQSLMKSLDCLEPEERHNSFVLCLAKFQSYEDLQKQNLDYLQKDKLSLHGTLLLQIILEFNKPIKIVNSILSMESKDLKGLLGNTMGSHIVNSYVKSTFVGEKSREKLVRKMKGTYQELAATKYGSRSFEAIWNAAHLKNRLAIMEELAYKDGVWSNSEYGKIIAYKVHLNLYKRNKDEWRNSVNAVSKAEELFADILK